MFTDQERMILGIIVIVYFALLFGFSLYINHRQIKSYDDYNVAGRSVSIFPLILTFVGTAIGGASLLGYMENAYKLGMGQQWLNIGGLIAGAIMAYVFLKKIREIGEKHHMVTIGDYTALRFGEAARIPTVISILVAYCAITGMQFVAIATILNLTIGISMTLGIIISWLMLTLKTYFGGLKSVIWQDAIHGTIQTLGIVLLFIVVILVSGGWSAMSENAIALNQADQISIFGITPTEILIYLLTIGAYQFVRQDLWQRFWAAKDYKTAMRGYWISIIVAALTGIFVMTIGIFAKFGLQLESANPALIYYEVIGTIFSFPLVVVMIVVLLATVISTADSFFMAGASSIINDIIKPRLHQPTDAKLLLYSRYSVALVSIFALLLALYIPQLVNLWVTGTAMLVSGLLAPVTFGLFWKRTTKVAGVASMWIGLVVATTWQILGHPFGIHPVFLGLPISIVSLVVMTLLTKADVEEEELREAK